jgi:phosphoribosyl 1,2-cyclic phosphate phosphodiesterase
MGEALTVTFLGTGTSQGVPPIGCNSEVCLSANPKDKRLRSSIYLQYKDKSLVIDTGPDFRYQLLREGITDVDAVLFTHEHRDHTGGLDDIRPINFNHHQKRIPVYCHKRVLDAFKLQYSYFFQEVPYPGIPLVDFHLINENDPFEVIGLHIEPIEVLHYRLPVLGFRFGKFAYITDANFISERELAKLVGVEVLVLNALRRTPHISHFTLDEATELAIGIGAKQTYFTHMSHQMGLHDTVCAELPEGIDLAYDGLKVVIE